MFTNILLCLIISTFSAYVSSSVKVPKYLAVYYGYPSLVENSHNDLIKATNWFKQFNLIVFGDRLWNISHDDHSNTKVIIKKLIGHKKKIFGYICLGVNGTDSPNFSESQMRTIVDAWSKMGANGILWDEAGYDYGVTRSRQSNMIRYCHSKGMNVIMNAWNPDHVMGGTNVQLNSNDIYLLESYLVANGRYMSLNEWKIKADKCTNYQKRLGVQMACLSSTNTKNQFMQAWIGTAMYNFDYFQATDINYGATNNSLPFYANPRSRYGKVWKNDEIQLDATKGRFSRSTDLWTLSIEGDGATWGYGKFSRR